MKKIILGLAVITSLTAQAQVEDTVSIEAGYTNQTWYSLENGEQGTRIGTDWDLAFGLSGFGTSIRINSAYGGKLWIYPNGDISDWATVDTTNMSSFQSLSNADTTWSIGAFDKNVDINNVNDIGWGTYNPNTHIIAGDSIYIYKNVNGDYIKIRIDDLTNGSFNFTYANIDGTNEMSGSVDKTLYTDKQFGYYSIVNNTALDHEPVVIDNWDLIFTKHTAFIPTPYGVSGLYAGQNTEVAKEIGVADTLNFNDWWGASFSTEINTIGHDWKSYDMGSSAYVVEDSLVYFVKTNAGDIWKVIPTGFGGSANGNFAFTKEKISTASLDKEGTLESQLVVYPNPASENVSILFDGVPKGDVTVQIMGLNGQVVYQSQHVSNGTLEVKNITINSFKSGVYIVNIATSNQQFIQKLILK